MKHNEKNLTAELLEKIARKSIEITADSRCVYLYHQPKMPAGIKQFKK